jgi:hypothetical protein
MNQSLAPHTTCTLKWHQPRDSTPRFAPRRHRLLGRLSCSLPNKLRWLFVHEDWWNSMEEGNAVSSTISWRQIRATEYCNHNSFWTALKGRDLASYAQYVIESLRLWINHSGVVSRIIRHSRSLYVFCVCCCFSSLGFHCRALRSARPRGRSPRKWDPAFDPLYPAQGESDRPFGNGSDGKSDPPWANQ